MSEVQSDIDQRGMQKAPVCFEKTGCDRLPFIWPQEFDGERLHQETVNAMALWDTSIQPLNNSGGLKGKIKKMLNRIAIYSVRTHMISQNAFNVSVVSALMQVNKLAEDNKNMRKEIQILKSEVEELRKQK